MEKKTVKATQNTETMELTLDQMDKVSGGAEPYVFEACEGDSLPQFRDKDIEYLKFRFETHNPIDNVQKPVGDDFEPPI